MAVRIYFRGRRACLDRWRLRRSPLFFGTLRWSHHGNLVLYAAVLALRGISFFRHRLLNVIIDISRESMAGSKFQLRLSRLTTTATESPSVVLKEGKLIVSDLLAKILSSCTPISEFIVLTPQPGQQGRSLEPRSIIVGSFSFHSACLLASIPPFFSRSDSRPARARLDCCRRFGLPLELVYGSDRVVWQVSPGQAGSCFGQSHPTRELDRAHKRSKQRSIQLLGLGWP